MLNKWNCIIITCPTVSSCNEVDEAISILKKKKIIPEDLLVVTVEDPAKNIGSGAATLNALLKAAEHLSAKQDYMVVSSDVLNEARILILHNGRKSVFTFTEKAFITLPLQSLTNDDGNIVYTNGIISNLEMTLRLIDEMSSNSPYGVWVCGTDVMVLHGKQKLVVDWQDIADVAMFCIPADVKYATGHGVVAIDEQGLISDIIYCGAEDQIKDLVISDGKVPLVSGIVYMSVSVAESLLSLHAQAPLDSCTYLGLDSGSDPIQVSLFFDLLVVMSSKIDKESFMNGKCGKIYNLKCGLTIGSASENNLARRTVWDTLSKFRMSPKILTGCQHLYWSNDCARSHMDKLFLIAEKKAPSYCANVHCFYSMNNPKNFNCSKKSLNVNSTGCIKDFYKISSGSVVYDSNFYVQSLHVGSNSFISGVDFRDLACELRIPSDLAIISTSTRNPENEFFIMFGVNENLEVPVDFNSDTFCNKPWKEQLTFLKLTEEDLWPADLDSKQRTLMNAKLFIPSKSLTFILDLFQNSNDTDPAIVDEYQKISLPKRYSIREILDAVDLRKAYEFRRSVYSIIGQDIMKSILLESKDLPLMPYIIAACAELWHTQAMDVIDKVLLSDANFTVKTRALSNMADLLGELAGSKGGLRSGPGSNPSWKEGLRLIMKERMNEGIKALQTERAKWLFRPDHLIRAARHYERAAQIFIQTSVGTVLKAYNVTKTSPPCDIGSYVTATCPARIDIQGGWSDTPPICYELGGSVVNIALRIDGEKPIGAKVHRTKEPTVVLKQRSRDVCVELVMKDINDVNNFHQPHLTGALVKAALIVTQVVDLLSDVPFSEQLLSKFQGGFLIETWSLLPQGCGLGTSSILAAAIVAALWHITGYTFDSQCLIHAVLIVEQLLTTGGGWQDQVAGVVGGINRGYSEGSLPLVVKVDKLSLSPEFIKKLNDRLLLLYTGKVRLAKNLLQHVIRNWYSKESSVVSCFENLVSNSHQMKEALKNEDLAKIGELMDKYWEQKKFLAPGCEPLVVKTIMEKLKPICYGQLLAGAGGGGFMCVLTKEPNAKEAVKDILTTVEGNESMSLHSATIDFSGLEIEHDGYVFCCNGQ